MALKIAKMNGRSGTGIIIQNKTERKTRCRVTTVRLHDAVEVATRSRWLCFWVAGREVRVGPLTCDQAEKLAEDLEYDAVS